MATTHSAIVVLYDPATGNIIHGHYCEADSSADLPDKAMLEQSAMEYAKRHAKKGVDPSKGQFLHVGRSHSDGAEAPRRSDTQEARRRVKPRERMA